MRRIVPVMIVLLFTFLTFKGVIYAEDTTVNIDYNARTKTFSLEEHQDLFVDLKQVVPGDNLTQNINLKVINLKNTEAVNIYLQAENPNEDYNTLERLDDVNLTVNRNGEGIEGKMNEPILLGCFSENDTVNIEVNLAVAETVGNEIANLAADIDWIFTAEVIENTDMPKTGDDVNMQGIAIICMISLVFIVIIIFYKKIKINS